MHIQSFIHCFSWDNYIHGTLLPTAYKLMNNGQAHDAKVCLLDNWLTRPHLHIRRYMQCVRCAYAHCVYASHLALTGVCQILSTERWTCMKFAFIPSVCICQAGDAQQQQQQQKWHWIEIKELQTHRTSVVCCMHNMRMRMHVHITHAQSVLHSFFFSLYIYVVVVIIIIISFVCTYCWAIAVFSRAQAQALLGWQWLKATHR